MMPPKVTKLRQNPSQTQRPEYDENDVETWIRPIGFAKDDPIKILLYGRPGTGKTTLWSTFPAPILCIIFSGGLEPDEIRSIDTKENRTRIKQVTPRSTQQMPALINHIDQTGHYKTVVMDHCSGYQDLSLKEVLGLGEIPATKNWGMAHKDQYGQVTTMCKEVFRKILNLKTNVVFIAQERNFGEKSEGESDVFQPAVGPALMPQLAGWLNFACSYIGQTVIRQKTVNTVMQVGEEQIPMTEKVKGVDYCLRTEPHPVVTTKFRVPGGNVPDYIIDPTYDKIIKLIRGL